MGQVLEPLNPSACSPKPGYKEGVWILIVQMALGRRNLDLRLSYEHSNPSNRHANLPTPNTSISKIGSTTPAVICMDVRIDHATNPDSRFSLLQTDRKPHHTVADARTAKRLVNIQTKR